MSNGRANESNGLGLAGFIVSLVGLCSGGLLSPIGLILSLVALGRSPKGFAIAGVVLGALGLCAFLPGIIVLALVAPLVVASILVALGATGLAIALGLSDVEAQIEMAIIADRVEERLVEDGALPPTLDGLGLTPEQRNDPWDRPYVYEPQPDGTFRLFSAGEEGQPGTEDDIERDENWRIDVN